MTLEAGYPLDQAIHDSSRELRQVHPELSGELAILSGELRGGRSRAEALSELAGRNRDPELRKMCKILIDTERFGASLAPALRGHARQLRVKRRQQAQEAARKVGVKLVFPVFFLIFPSVVLITLGPAVLQIMQAFGPLMNHP
jgi:tight adherence protein C